MLCTEVKNSINGYCGDCSNCIIKFGVEDLDTYDTWVKVQELINDLYID